MAETEVVKRGRTLTGTVVSNKARQTITVLVERRVPHPVYGKIIRRTTKVHAHDPASECNVGDVVTLRESRPISKTKNWVLERIEERAAAELPRIDA